MPNISTILVSLCVHCQCQAILYSVMHSIKGWSDSHLVCRLATESMVVIRFMMADIQVDGSCMYIHKNMPTITPTRECRYVICYATYHMKLYY